MKKKVGKVITHNRGRKKLYSQNTDKKVIPKILIYRDCFPLCLAAVLQGEPVGIGKKKYPESAIPKHCKNYYDENLVYPPAYPDHG